MSKNIGNGPLSQPSQSSIDGFRLRALLIAGLVIFICAAVAWPLRLALAVEFVLIHNAKTGTNSVTKSELKDMAIGRKKAWPSGAPVQLVLQSVGTPEMKWFALYAAGISDDTLASKMKQEVFKGELRRPINVSSDKSCLSAVANDPGAVGVVSAETAKSLPDGVAVLAVQ
jgi:hypothetical protein